MVTCLNTPIRKCSHAHPFYCPQQPQLDCLDQQETLICSQTSSSRTKLDDEDQDCFYYATGFSVLAFVSKKLIICIVICPYINNTMVINVIRLPATKIRPHNSENSEGKNEFN